MKRIVVLRALAMMSCIVFAQSDAEGCKDHILSTRLSYFFITECSENYNELNLRVSEEKTETKEGDLFSITYYYDFDKSKMARSPLQVIKKYENAVATNSGEMVYRNVNPQDASVEATFHLATKKKEYWIKVGSFGGTANAVEHFTLYVLEMVPMKQEVQADSMIKVLNEEGGIALCINFETGKSDIKPESENIVNQIAGMLKQNRGLKIGIEGHTDNMGGVTSNQKLSDERAQTVSKTLEAFGIDNSRLKSRGWGASKPIADNRTGEGGAKNKRVVLAKE